MYLYSHWYQKYSHPHNLRASTTSSVSAFSPPSHLQRWSAKTTAVMDGSRPQDLYNVYLPARQRFTRTFSDHAESMSCNLNRSGDGRRGTRTQLKLVKDRQARTRVPRGGACPTDKRPDDTRGGGTTLVRVNERGRRPERVHIFKVCWCILLSEEGQHASCNKIAAWQWWWETDHHPSQRVVHTW